METWLIFSAICLLLLCLIVTVLILIGYSGVFEGVEVGAGKPHVGRLVIAYTFARGPYKSVGPLFFEVAKIAPDHRALGIYYDDPEKVESHRLRYAVACILAEGDQEEDAQLKKKFESRGFQVMELPQVDNVVRTSFPYKSAFSIFIGVKKVYPKLGQYIRENELQAHPFVEIYDGNTIHFMAPLDKQVQFYVPESLQKFPGEEPYEYIYSDDTTEDVSQSHTASPEDDEEEPSLLHPSQIVKNALPEEEGIKQEDMKLADVPSPAKDSKQEAAEVEAESAMIKSLTEEGQGSDEESTSSFEEVKFEGIDEKAMVQ